MFVLISGSQGKYQIGCLYAFLGLEVNTRFLCCGPHVLTESFSPQRRTLALLKCLGAAVRHRLLLTVRIIRSLPSSIEIATHSGTGEFPHRLSIFYFHLRNAFSTCCICILYKCYNIILQTYTIIYYPIL